jgi:hypothetical protein
VQWPPASRGQCGSTQTSSRLDTQRWSEQRERGNAQEVSTISGRVGALETRLREVETVIQRLEAAAETTARALEEVSSHWDAVYRAMRRAE